uniref:4'-phosphopantetheinyl transferase family protein n=1 Tax=Cellulosimicrobium cellulans TaxID=1710 RepID=UPI000A3F72D0
GATGHGKPELAAALAAGLHVSVSTAPGLLAVAVSDEGPVGVDVESVAAVGAAPVADVLLHPREAAAGPRALARTWVRKEALLKATGHGLVVPPAELVVAGPDEPPALLLAPPWLGVGPADQLTLRDLADADLASLGRDHVGAVAVLPR